MDSSPPPPPPPEPSTIVAEVAKHIVTPECLCTCNSTVPDDGERAKWLAGAVPYEAESVATAALWLQTAVAEETDRCAEQVTKAVVRGCRVWSASRFVCFAGAGFDPRLGGHLRRVTAPRVR